MKVAYDPDVDVLTITLSNAVIEESNEEKSGVILDYDAIGNLVGLEILEASKIVGNPRELEHVITENVAYVKKDDELTRIKGFPPTSLAGEFFQQMT
jgi:uncharacterized protein YuzE